MHIQDKLNVLIRIAQAFDGAGITWAVGASLMLYLRGIAADFHDIDLTVAEEDVACAKSVLQGMGILHPSEKHPGFRTRHFLQFTIDGVDVDLLAGFTILHDGREHYFPLPKDADFERMQLHGASIPLQSLQQWRECYRLMGRESKMHIIDQYLNQRSNQR